MLALKVGSLRTVFIEFLNNLAANHFFEQKDRRSFTINNLDFIMNTLKQLVHNDSSSSEVDVYFRELEKCLTLMQKQLMNDYFGSLDLLVQKHFQTEEQ